MGKKIVAYFAILAIVVSVFSCYTIKRISPAAAKEGENIKAFTTTDGKHIEFDKKYPGVLRQDALKFNKKTRIEQVISIEQKNIKKLNRNSLGKIVSVETNDDGYYVVLEPLLENDTKTEFIGCLFSELVELKLADIKQLYVERLNWLGTISVTALSVSALLFFLEKSKKDPVPPTPPSPPGPPPQPSPVWQWGG